MYFLLRRSIRPDRCADGACPSLLPVAAQASNRSSIMTTLKSMRTPLALALALAAIAASSASVLGQQVDPSPTTKPPARFGGAGQSHRWIPLTHADAKCSAAYSLDDRTLTLWWAWTANGSRPRQTSAQVESLAFWPTSVMGAGKDRLLVAGRRRSGNTVIELWTFGSIPQLKGTDEGEGNWSYPELTVPIASRATVFDENTAGRTLVGSMFWNPQTAAGDKVSIFVVFDDSRDLCGISLHNDDSYAVQRLFSKSSGTGVPQVSQLDCFHESRWSGNHTVSGYTYILTNTPNSGGVCDTIVLLDRNRDGAIDNDGVLLPNNTEWTTSNLWDGTTYVEFY
jgi:hypothetical protein